MSDTARNFILEIKPIPKPIHGNNLRIALGQYAWKQLRQAILNERGVRCDTCGKRPESGAQLFCHEDWSYDVSQVPAVATIKIIILSLWLCHACDHFPLTLILRSEGQIGDKGVEEAVAHFCSVNHVSRADFE